LTPAVTCPVRRQFLEGVFAFSLCCGYRGIEEKMIGIAASYFRQWIYFRREALVLISRFIANRTEPNCTFILGQVANNNWAFQQGLSATTHQKISSLFLFWAKIKFWVVTLHCGIF
jgi:hypothetical protein